MIPFRKSACITQTRWLATLSLAAGATLLTAPIASASNSDDSTFSISLGVFVTDQETNIQLNGNAGERGTSVDFERDLGLDNSDSVFRIDAYYRFNQNHRLDFSAFDLSRSSSAVIDKEIEWNGEVYPLNTTVSSEFDLTIYKAAYTWSFIARDSGYLGVSLGVYVADVGVSLEAKGISIRASSEVTAPLPVIGLRGRYDLTEKLTFRASGEVFAIEYQDFDGSLFDFYAGLDYQFFEHVALGIGYNRATLDVGVSKSSFNGDFDWRYNGGSLYVKFDF